jgi:hypothetical protein
MQDKTVKSLRHFQVTILLTFQRSLSSSHIIEYSSLRFLCNVRVGVVAAIALNSNTIKTFQALEERCTGLCQLVHLMLLSPSSHDGTHMYQRCLEQR